MILRTNTENAYGIADNGVGQTRSLNWDFRDLRIFWTLNSSSSLFCTILHFAIVPLFIDVVAVLWAFAITEVFTNILERLVNRGSTFGLVPTEIGICRPRIGT